MISRPTTVALLLAPIALAGAPGLAGADGGTVRLSERLGPYQVSVFTTPVPFRAGPVDVSVLVLDAATARPASDVQVMIGVAPVDQPQAMSRYPATSETATNKLFHAAAFDLPAPGRWLVAVSIDGPQGPAQTRFEVSAAEPPPRWIEMGFWIGLPVVPILLFAIYQLLTWRSLRLARSQRRRSGPPSPLAPG
jgi:hypothetical protein